VDTLKFYDITHRDHVVCKPTSEENIARLVGLLRLPAGARVVDIASGKGEFLIRLAEAYGARCIGVDVSPYFLHEAEARVKARGLVANVSFRQMDGADFGADAPQSFALASCIGASWIFRGHGGTLDALVGMTEPGGWVIAGEPYWLREPSADYLEASGEARAGFGSHLSNAEAGVQRGLELVYTLVSNQNDWDRYEGLQWYATAEYARTHPDDPDLPELVQRVAKNKETYLRWGRDTLGFAIYVFRRRTAESAHCAPAA
jgi:SAM-dependent methyltransferase